MADGWKCYISDLMNCEECKDAVIVGLDNFSVWASHEGGCLGCVQPKQIEALLAKDTGSLFCHGVTLGDKKYTIIRHELNGDDAFIDLKGKSDCEDQKCSLTVAKSNKALIILEGKYTPAAAGTVCDKAVKMADYLRRRGY